MPRKEEAYPNVISIIIIIIFAVSIVAIASTLTESGNFGIAQGQANDTSSSLASSLTSEQRDALCNPNNPLSMLKSVNTTESEICGIPKTQPSNATTTTSAVNTTTIRTEAPSSPIPGLLMPEQPPSQPTQSESIQSPPAKSIAPSAKSIAPQIPPTG